MNPAALLAPLFLLFELWQLVISERYIGIRQIRLNLDPRELPMKAWVAAVWSIGLLGYGLWMVLLLLFPVGRAQAVVLLAVTVLGYAARAAASMKWTLVILTFEGAVRVGMLLSLIVTVWRRLSG